jgi:SAM-dependent methyltransferase
MRDPWNHNIHYHDLVLRSVPADCRRALDVGCGEGLLASRLAVRCAEVVAIDPYFPGLPGLPPNVRYLRGDVMTHAFPSASFDFIAAIATLHHLPLRPALELFRDLLRPGGVLAVIGLYRSHTLSDYAAAAVAFPSSFALRRIRGFAEVAAPIQDPRETLAEVRSAARDILPGATFQRRLLFRYSLLWRKPNI